MLPYRTLFYDILREGCRPKPSHDDSAANPEGAPAAARDLVSNGPGAIPVLELMGLQRPAEILNLSPGIHTPVEDLFRHITPVVPQWRGRSPQERPINAGIFKKSALLASSISFGSMILNEL